LPWLGIRLPVVDSKDTLADTKVTLKHDPNKPDSGERTQNAKRANKVPNA